MEEGYNTNLAAEFYVLSVLHRLGVSATLTLGNKKSVDIVITRDAGNAIVIPLRRARESWKKYQDAWQLLR